MPQVALVLLNATGIVAGLVVMADPAPTWLSVTWATMIVLILGRMIIESVRGGHDEDAAAGPSEPAAVPLAAAAR